MNVLKLLRRMNDQPEPPCTGCKNYDYCEETEKCCKGFMEYVNFGSWRDKDFVPSYYTCIPDSGVSVKELSNACGINTSELQILLWSVERHSLAFEQTGFYFYRDIENDISKIKPRSGRLRKAKVTLCQILLDSKKSIDSVGTNNLVREIRRNVWCITRGVC